MSSLGAPELLHVVGYLTGASLYAMLLVMVVQTPGPANRLTLGTALLGLAWNLGELGAHAFEAGGVVPARDWMAGGSYVALGFLAAVVVHSAARRQVEDSAPPLPWSARLVAPAAYGCAGFAGLMQLFAAATGRPLPWSAALVLLTTGLTALALTVRVTARDQPDARRGFWMIGLALFAVSALHLSSFHGTAESWPTELLGHHASIPLAFAILYQDYRFAFADLFLKRALTLLVLVAGVFIGWSLVASSVSTASTVSPAIGALLAMWVATALLFPWLRRRVSAFVDRVLLTRSDYTTLLEDLASALQNCASESAVLTHACAVLTPALSATSVTWQATAAVAEPRTLGVVHILTAEEPRPVLSIGLLSGGRRLLSDDTMLLERVAHLVGRRIDALRISDERYERILREREMTALAAEAELKALRAQINPHFLFNTLTTLGYLIQVAPTRAFDTLMRLTTLLRSVLRSEGAFTTLGHEQELIECYLEIERERFEERLTTRIEIPTALRPLTVPALIVQPLVENAIKHGIAGSRDGGSVVVSATTTKEPPFFLHVLVRNTGAPLGASVDAGSGIGLQHVLNRLRCNYGDAAALTLFTNEFGETVAEVRLPIDAAIDEDASALVERTHP